MGTLATLAGGPDFDFPGTSKTRGAPSFAVLQRAGIHAIYAIEHGSHRVLSELNHFPRPRRCRIERVYTRPCKKTQGRGTLFLGCENGNQDQDQRLGHPPAP